MLLASTCAACGRRGPSPCPACHARLLPAGAVAPPPGVAGLWALLAYVGPARDLVARVKYRNQRAALDWLAQGMAALVPARSVAVVTWAPTTTAHRRQRGFDHGELLARAVARRLARPARPLLLREGAVAQTGRPAQQRRSCGPRFTPAGPGPAGPVLVVDDVLTTGTTLSAAATALTRAGAGPVLAVVAARTLPIGLSPS